MTAHATPSVPACPVCGGDHAALFFSLSDQPVLIGVLWPDADSARACRRGDIDLAFCPDCGFIWNVSFDPDRIEYDQQYDNSLHFSPTFQNYSQKLVDRLIDTYGLHQRTVVDIGCGKGDFLAMLCEAGGNTGYGFDPSYEGERVSTSAADRITWSNDYYGEEHARLQADLLASRFVYEHIPAPNEFLRMIRRSITDPDRTVIYFEVPDTDLIIRQGSVWDVIYEHCSYFSVESLTRSFSACGFDVLRVEETFEKQFLTIEARAAGTDTGNPGNDTGNLGQLAADIAAFGETQSTKMSDWRDRLTQWRAEGRRAVAWGAGAKAVGFLNMLGDRDTITRVVDINPHKQGKHLAGTGQQIISPQALTEDPPDVVVLMNPIYRNEIAAQLAELGLTPELINS
ncbi:class I SAM-dependent methyltransferase [Ruegeria sp. Alg231-54]|uniref:class I SAM-dependent methyltransferase n=1 Tax=Ruegeria sp. Alg231-54 TaxID=1922221 RepID=UPI000D54F3D0|nr:class I SAM-dependent methyltransferase [Ruegeria sp. Alg231-54]